VKALLLLVVLALPASAQAPEPPAVEERGIYVSEEERARIISEFQKLQAIAEELAKRYKTCMNSRTA
jgi:hypothetical protein